MSDISESGNLLEHSEHDVKATPHIWALFRLTRAVLQVSTRLADFVDETRSTWTNHEGKF